MSEERAGRAGAGAGPALRRRGATEEERRQAAAAMGSASTPAKAAAARANGFKPGNSLGGRKAAPLSSIECRCEAGAALSGHRWDCPRGKAIKRRQADGATDDELRAQLQGAGQKAGGGGEG